MAGRIAKHRHSDRAWRIGEIASDFQLIDAWALPVSGSLEEFSDLCDIFARFGPNQGDQSGPSNWLFAIRMWLGRRLGWDERKEPLPIPGCRETSLRARLPPDLPAAGGENEGAFQPVYWTQTEWAAEISNSTVHGVLHLGWVPRKDGSYRGQMGVYVKPRGLFGRLYMMAIAPFRYLIVYPALMRRIRRDWEKRSAMRHPAA